MSSLFREEIVKELLYSALFGLVGSVLLGVAAFIFFFFVEYEKTIMMSKFRISGRRIAAVTGDKPMTKTSDQPDALNAESELLDAARGPSASCLSPLADAALAYVDALGREKPANLGRGWLAYQLKTFAAQAIVDDRRKLLADDDEAIAVMAQSAAAWLRLNDHERDDLYCNMRAVLAALRKKWSVG
jgi:hypothetical protein